MRQKITKYRLFKGLPGSDGRWVKDSLNHCQVYGVQLSTSTSALECTFDVFQTRSLFTNGIPDIFKNPKYFKCFKLAASSRTTSHTGIPEPLESCTSCFRWLRCSTTPAFPILPGTTKILIITYRRLKMTKILYDQSPLFFPNIASKNVRHWTAFFCMSFHQNLPHHPMKKSNIIFRTSTLRSVRREADGGFLMRVVAARPIKKGKMKWFCFF